ncbi:MAG: VCBS repeat-containing protein, partial [Acidobacteria bacterium]|nr:VCBS repeat-containing protein [Acidobacteriota bacterium]
MGSAAGDFNRDGFTDLVVVNALSGNYSVLLGNGSGTFLLVSNIAIGTYPHSVASADLNADGKLDLVVTAEYEVRVLLGNGDGTFSLVTVLHPGQGARFPVVADFNRDGKPDLAIAVYTGGNVSLYQGNGNGTFQSPAVYPNAYTTKILLGDFNRDGNPDVISTRGYDDGTVKVWLGTGAGTLQGGAEFPDTLQYLDAVTADFNGDGRLDLALSRGAYTDIRLGNGDG